MQALTGREGAGGNKCHAWYLSLQSLQSDPLDPQERELQLVARQ